MIIQIRGTSGSGKTTAMRKVAEAVGGRRWEPVFVQVFKGKKRRNPLYYRSTPNEQWPTKMLLMGHYEIDCGGCDTLGSAPDVFNVIQAAQLVEGNVPILSEGLLWSEDVVWSLELVKLGFPVFPFYLTTPVEECLRRVQQRQAGRVPPDPERVVRKLTRRVETIDRTRARLIEAGVSCRRCSSDQAPRLILERLRLHAQQGV